MKILLFGKGGQVGWELQRSLAPLGDLVALDFDSTDLHADFTRPAALADTVRAVAPDVIVNAAAHTAVDKAESEPELAATLNAEAPRVLAAEAAARHAASAPSSRDAGSNCGATNVRRAPGGTDSRVTTATWSTCKQ